MNLAARVIGSILKHDRKVNSYKIALVRAFNDVVLSYPDLVDANVDVAVPLRRLAQQWLAYYWPFMDPGSPVLQGPRARRRGVLGNDVSFRPALTRLRAAWADHFGPARPSDGFLVVAELRVPRIAASYPLELRRSFRAAVSAISGALQQPIQYAGPGGTRYHVFPPPRPAAAWAGALPVPGTAAEEPCVLIGADLWAAFHELSLWIEALCVHEWSLFTERSIASGIDRGRAYSLLTSRPDNRRPLTWERNQVELIMLEGGTFECPWTAKKPSPSPSTRPTSSGTSSPPTPASTPTSSAPGCRRLRRWRGRPQSSRERTNSTRHCRASKMRWARISRNASPSRQWPDRRISPLRSRGPRSP